MGIAEGEEATFPLAANLPRWLLQQMTSAASSNVMRADNDDASQAARDLETGREQS